jgi:hypothetical protein
MIRHGLKKPLTPARLLVEEVNGISEIRLWPREFNNPLHALLSLDQLERPSF